MSAKLNPFVILRYSGSAFLFILTSRNGTLKNSRNGTLKIDPIAFKPPYLPNFMGTLKAKFRYRQGYFDENPDCPYLLNSVRALLREKSSWTGG
jgi:hypothetical protein